MNSAIHKILDMYGISEIKKVNIKYNNFRHRIIFIDNMDREIEMQLNVPETDIWYELYTSEIDTEKIESVYSGLELTDVYEKAKEVFKDKTDDIELVFIERMIGVENKEPEVDRQFKTIVMEEE
tara:strand:+ start:832 stop:1203 length:372 start_codon:yes stop_codon:yes gene_type:complete